MARHAASGPVEASIAGGRATTTKAGASRTAPAHSRYRQAATPTSRSRADGGGCARRDDGLLACWDLDKVVTSSLDEIPRRSVTMRSHDGRGDRVLRSRTNGTTLGRGRSPPQGSSSRLDGARERGCALRDTGALACWGRSGQRQDGNDLAMPTPSGTYKAVSVGGVLRLRAPDRRPRRLLERRHGDRSSRPRWSQSRLPELRARHRIPVAWRAITVGGADRRLRRRVHDRPVDETRGRRSRRHVDAPADRDPEDEGRADRRGRQGVLVARSRARRRRPRIGLVGDLRHGRAARRPRAPGLGPVEDGA